jgi:two-component system sensor histidine kinase/response regulator
MKTILVIDDDAALCNMLSTALKQGGHHALTADSGSVGIELARKYLPDLILCDIAMPGMDGRSVLQALREDSELGATQIVLMTGNVRDVTPRSGMELGADDFLVKPFTFDELTRCVDARLKRASVHWRVEDKVARELRSALKSTLPHEFLTPLTGILGLTQLLLDDHPNTDADVAREMLQDIDKAGKRLHRTMKNYFAILDLQMEQIEGALSVDTLSAGEVSAAILAGISAAVHRHERQDDVSSQFADCAVRFAENALTTITEELVDNACSFSRPGTPIKVRLNPTGTLIVQDQGRGILPQHIEKIGAFMQFDRKKYEQQGLGLGLVLTQNLVSHYGGRLSLASEPGVGTTVSVALPLAHS